MRRRNVFVVGLDETIRDHLERVAEDREALTLHGVLSPRELWALRAESLDTMLARAVDRIAATRRSVDAVVGFGRFPVPALVSLLRERHDLPGPRLGTVAGTEHRGWSRLLQLRAAPQEVLPFRVFDASVDVDVDALDFDLPFWISPVVGGLASRLHARISSREDFEPAMVRIRSAMASFGPAFEDMLERVEVPRCFAGVGARHCLVEPAVGGRHCRVEAYAHRDGVHTYGISDCLPHVRESGLARSQYPSHLPFPLQDEIRGTVGRLGRALGLLDTTFSVDLVCDENDDRLRVFDVELGPVVDDVHLFELVDGSSGCAVALELALGRRPHYVHGRGRFGCAARFLLRTLQGAVVTRTPTPEELRRIRRALPFTNVEVRAQVGDRLCKAARRLSGDLELASITVGGPDLAALEEDYEECKPMLNFGFSEPGTRWR
jgi:hypothetical protein